ncbi:MAG TPA: HNH endonuclease [Paucimonas sp.]|nr:HNH endonuclease [Paucimonas sp.]
MADQLRGVNAESLSDQAATDLLSKINAQTAAVIEFQAALSQLPLTGLRDLSFDTANALLRFTGGMQNLQTALGAFEQNFYTEAERMDRLGESVAESLESLGYTSIDTKEELRGLIEGFRVVDDSTAQTFASLLNLAPAFAQVADYNKQMADEAIENARRQAEETARIQEESVRMAEQAARMAEDAARAVAEQRQRTYEDLINFSQQKIDNALAALSQSVSSEKEALQRSYEAQAKLIRDRSEAEKAAARASIDASRLQAQGASDSLRDIQRVYDMLDSALSAARPMSRLSAQGQLELALEQARNGGSLVNYPRLDEVLRAATAANPQSFGSLLDFQRDQVRTANMIAELKSKAGAQVSVAQMTLDAINGVIAATEQSITATSAERGYDRRWRKARERFLQEHPLCVYCEAQGMTTAASVVDHRIPHRGDTILFWDKSNWQSLCKPCHDGRKQREEAAEPAT